MRSFKDILTESKKTYQFKIGIAGELPEGCTDSLETALKKFKVLNLTSGKKNTNSRTSTRLSTATKYGSNLF